MSRVKRAPSGKQKAQEKKLSWKQLTSLLLALVLFALMGTGAVWGMAKLQDPGVLPLKVVRIDGDFHHLKRSDLERAIGSVMQGNFFTVDLDGVREAALSLPWVEKVTVRRIWPGTLKVWVGEQTPLARWGKKRLVNADGVVFVPKAEEIPEGLPELFGPDDESKEVVSRYLEMVDQMAVLSLNIERVVMDDRRSWTLVFRKGLTLRLGSRERARRLNRFMKFYKRLEPADIGRLQVMDLRYTNGIAVRWQNDNSDKRQEAIGSGAANKLGLMSDAAGGAV